MRGLWLVEWLCAALHRYLSPDLFTFHLCARWRVVVYTHDVYPNITSAAAGALWEYPPYMIRAAALPLAKRWSLRTMERLLAVSHEYPTAGVGPVNLIAGRWSPHAMHTVPALRPTTHM